MSTAAVDSSTLAALADSSTGATTTANSATRPTATDDSATRPTVTENSSTRPTATEDSASQPTATEDSSGRVESVVLPLSAAVSESESITKSEQISTESSLLNNSAAQPVWPLNTNSQELNIHHHPRSTETSSSTRLSLSSPPPTPYNYGRIPEMPPNNYGASPVMMPREGQNFGPRGSYHGKNRWRRPHQPVRPFIRHPQPFVPYQFGRPFVSPPPFAPPQSGRPFVSSPLPFVPQQFGRPFISSPLPLVPDQSPFVSPPPPPPPPPPYGFDSPTAFSDTTPYIPFESYKPVPVPTLIKKQIEYYFSGVNLQTDEHLKSKMDNQGWVPITLIADFPRVKSLTSDIGLILESLKYSTVVEVQDDKVRKHNDWMKWIPTSGQNEKEGTPPTRH